MRATEISAPLEFCGQSFFSSNDLNDHRQKHLLINLISKRWPFRREIYAKFVKNLKAVKNCSSSEASFPFLDEPFPSYSD